MPKIIGYTPSFLSRPSPGSKIFTDPAPQSPVSPSKRSSYLGSPPSTGYQGPRRLVANRGTEIFTVVGNKIRWADLATVQDEWEENTQSGTSRFGLSRSGTTEPSEEDVYRTLHVPIYYQIRQIIISPSGTFLAVCTEHTVHIAVLPPSSRLRDHDRSPLKLKTYHLGPTIHVIPESPLTSVLWHPLASSTTSTDCIVTVTAEAAVRVWELDRSNKWSFERPAVAIDLRKLADGVSCDQDFEPAGFGKTRGFSVDDFDMEVSAACFGGRGQEDEDAWASMTLWTAMRNGDIYALCPLLPYRWKPTPTTVSFLSTTVVSRMVSVAGEEIELGERRAADQQYEWVQEIDNEEPQRLQSTDSLGEFEIRLRPQNPSAIPRLQGPFTIVSEDDSTDIEISDIFVLPARIDEDDLEDEDDDFDRGPSTAIPFTTICIATPESELWFAIDLDGVSGQWLPKKHKSVFSVPSSDAKELTLIDTLALDNSATNATNNWPVFTSDIVQKNALFLTTSKHVYSLSLNDWIVRLGGELTGPEPIDPGLKTRLETSAQTQVCSIEKLIEVRDPSEVLSAPTIIDDVSFGYVLLSTTPSSAYSVSFDQVHLRASTIAPSSPELTTSPSRLNPQLSKIAEEGASTELESLPTRSPYVPAKIFYANHLYPLEQMRQRLPPNLKRAIYERPMRLSPAMLEIMTFAHRTIGVQSSELEKAAAELFRRCERLREELTHQVKQMSEMARRLQELQVGGEEDEEGHVVTKKDPERRITDAKERQAKLVTRYENLRRKVGRVACQKRELSQKEKGWIEEINGLGRNVGVDVGESEHDDNSEKGGNKNESLDRRFETVKQLTHSIVEESRRLESQLAQQHPPALEASASSISPSMSASMSTSILSTSTSKSAHSESPSSSFGVSSRLQKQRIADVMALVEREGAVIEAAMKRLDRLKGEY